MVTADLAGSMHCLDEKTGKRHGNSHTPAMFFGSPLILGETVMVANEDDSIDSIPSSNSLFEHEIRIDESFFVLHSSPIYANSTVYLTSYSEIFASPRRDMVAAPPKKTHKG